MPFPSFGKRSSTLAYARPTQVPASPGCRLLPFPSFGKRSAPLAYGRRFKGKGRGGVFHAAPLSLPLTKGITRATAAHAHCSHARSGLLRPGGRRPRRL